MDRTAGFHMVAGIAAALFHRERTGEGQELEFSLYHSGVWTLAADLQVAMGGLPLQIHDRKRAINPLVNTYRAGDGRWIQLAMLQPDLSWAGFCRALDRRELENDPRFADMERRAENNEELVAILDEAFATRPSREWEARLKAHDCIFGLVYTPEEAIADPQALANGFFVEMEHPVMGKAQMVTTPVKFGRNPASVRSPAPEVGQHTEEVLLEAGYTWDDIASLKEAGVIL
jgi:crotonobetainyl-CoA:carnitine CoA-transferase CaiB-like acyl-CoA transferase